MTAKLKSTRRLDASRPGRRRAVAMALFLSVVPVTGGVAAGRADSATAPGPAILSVGASTPHGQPLPATGQPVVVTVRVRNATTCTFLRQFSTFSSLYSLKTVPCSSGYASATMPAIANTYGKQVRLTYAVRVRGAGGRLVQRSVTVSEAAGGSATQPRPTAAPPPPAPAPTLAILSVSVSTSVVSASGGSVTVTVHATDAVTCTFSGQDISSLTVPCRSGSGGETITFAANIGPTITHTYVVVAQDAAGATTVPDSFTITQQGPPLPASLAAYLDICTPGPHCYYGPLYTTYQDYGNVAPVDLGDCTFAAAAHWEQIVLGLNPDPTLIGYEFANAGGTSAGLTADALFGYWQHQGINGVFLTGLHPYFTDQTDVENGVRSYGAMVVEFQFADGGYFAQFQMGAGGHMAVVDGFTPEGPLVVSWGQTLQMTWAQWNAEVVDMWGIGAG
jgi:hypothetical protein